MAFILKTFKYLISVAVAGHDRIMQTTRDAMFATAEAFFDFMDDFFMMDEEVELLVIAERGNTVHQVYANRKSKILRSLFSQKAPDPFVSAFNYQIDQEDRSSGYSHLSVDSKPRIVHQKYFRPFLFRTLNLFKPMVFKLPLKHSFYAHQTPV